MIIDKFLKHKFISRDYEKCLTLNDFANFWTSYLYERVIRLFEWTNLPFPQKEMEMRLLTFGHCGIVPLNNTFMVVKNSLYGVTEYFDEYTSFSWATPLGNMQGVGTHLIDDKHIDCLNDSLRSGVDWFINKYALSLAHCDLTMINSLVNKRADSSIIADTSNASESARVYLNNLYKGKQVPLNDSVYQSIRFNDNKSVSDDYIKAFELQKNLLTQFFESFGIASAYEKKGNMIDSEVTRNDNLLMININDMYKCRLEIAEKINKGYGTNVSVKCLVKVTEKGGSDNDN